MKEWDKEELHVTAKLSKLQSERNDLAQRLAEVELSLAHQKDGWRREREKTMALTYSKFVHVQPSQIILSWEG